MSGVDSFDRHFRQNAYHQDLVNNCKNLHWCQKAEKMLKKIVLSIYLGLSSPLSENRVFDFCDAVEIFERLLVNMPTSVWVGSSISVPAIDPYSVV